MKAEWIEQGNVGSSETVKCKGLLLLRTPASGSRPNRGLRNTHFSTLDHLSFVTVDNVSKSAWELEVVSFASPNCTVALSVWVALCMSADLGGTQASCLQLFFGRWCLLLEQHISCSGTQCCRRFNQQYFAFGSVVRYNNRFVDSVDGYKTGLNNA